MAKHRAEQTLGLSKTMIGNTRQLSRSLVGIYHGREISQNRILIVGPHPPTGLRKFHHGISIERVINLARERWTLRA